MKPTSMLRALRAVQRQLFQLSVIGVLAGIGWWGHVNHWGSAPSAEAALTSAHDHGQNNPAPSVSEPAAGAPRIVEFPSAQAVMDLEIRTAAAERRPLAREVSAAGVVTYEPSRLAQLSARGSGTVWRVEKQVGQAIHAGDVLAVIDAPAVGQAKADFLRAIADVQLRERHYERLSSFAQGEVPMRQVQEAETELRKARVDLFNSQQALISLGLPVDLRQWQSMTEDELQTQIKFLGLPPAIVKNLDANATTASLLPIVAPFDGLVIGRELSIGEVVSPTQSHFEVADVSRMWIVINVREADADDLELGQKVTFTGGSATVDSSISWLSTAVDEKTRTVEVRCETDNPELKNAAGDATGKRLLRANLFGVARIRFRENPNALTVPTKAVQRFDNTPLVFVRSGERTFEAREVQVGIVSGEWTEIIGGLNDGETITVEGSHVLKAELLRSASRQPTT